MIRKSASRVVRPRQFLLLRMGGSSVTKACSSYISSSINPQQQQQQSNWNTPTPTTMITKRNFGSSSVILLPVQSIPAMSGIQTTTTTSRRRRSSSNAADTMNTPVYVHPLSDSVLTYLQSTHGDFLARAGMSAAVSSSSSSSSTTTNLKIQADGTFVLSSSSSEEGVAAAETTGIAIWTSYDKLERKHYLNVRQDALVGRYILQDNTKSAWQMTLDPEKIYKAVDTMIQKLASSSSATSP